MESKQKTKERVMKTYKEIEELSFGHEVDNVYEKFCDYKFLENKGWFNMMRDTKDILDELRFIDSPLDNKRDYKYIFINRKQIEQELGDNLVICESGSVSIKHKQREA
tara:strand:+ start:524 stop:847 length:324 start_codon:yes stop_codon:yes gene_type:complete